MALICFGALPCRRKKNLMTARVSMLLKSRLSLTCFGACFLPGRAKDLSAPRVYVPPSATPQTLYFNSTFFLQYKANVQAHGPSDWHWLCSMWVMYSVYTLYSVRLHYEFNNTGLLKMINGVIHSTLQMQPRVISFCGVTSRIRFMFLLFPQVSRNWRYESEPPLKPSPLTCYKQFGTNSIIVLMFVESQRVRM